MKKNNIFIIIGLLITSVILFIPIIDKVSYGHDIEFHLTNMEAFLDKLKHFNLFSYKIFGSNILKGFGYGAFIFYPCLSYLLLSFVALFISLFNINIILSITYTMILIAFLSGITMYIFSQKLYNDKRISFLSAVSYISSTYFLCDTYARIALAEALVFIFIPIVFLAIYELLYGDTKKFYLWFVIGYIGMFNSHLIMTMYLTIVIIIWLLINYKKVFKINIIKKLTIASIIVLLICSPFLIPIIEHKIYGNYVVFDKGTMYTLEELKYHSVKLKEYFLPVSKTDHGIKVYFNYITLISMFLVLVTNKYILKDKTRKVYFSLLPVFIITLIMTTNFFPWIHLPNFLKNIQFPWRLCVILSFLLATFACPIIKVFPKKHQSKVFVVVIIMTIFFSMSSLKSLSSRFVNPDSYNYYIGQQLEYLPINTKESKYYYTRGKEIIFLKGTGEYQIKENNSPYLKFNIDINDECIIEIPRIYYLGYTINLIDESGKIKDIDYQEDNNGFIMLNLKESGEVIVKYTGTVLDKIAYLISIITIIISILIYIRSKGDN